MKQLTEDYVSYEIAKLLKEKGFDAGCSFVVNEISRGVMPVSWPTTNSDIEDEKASLIALPTLQMAMKWLREVHNIHIGTKPYNLQHPKTGKWYKTQTKAAIYNTKDGSLWGDMLIIEEFCEDTYEQAVEAALKYTLENLIRYERNTTKTD